MMTTFSTGWAGFVKDLWLWTTSKTFGGHSRLIKEEVGVDVMDSLSRLWKLWMEDTGTPTANKVPPQVIMYAGKSESSQFDSIKVPLFSLMHIVHFVPGRSKALPYCNHCDALSSLFFFFFCCSKLFQQQSSSLTFVRNIHFLILDSKIHPNLHCRWCGLMCNKCCWF